MACSFLSFDFSVLLSLCLVLSFIIETLLCSLFAGCFSGIIFAKFRGSQPGARQELFLPSFTLRGLAPARNYFCQGSRFAARRSPGIIFAKVRGSRPGARQELFLPRFALRGPGPARNYFCQVSRFAAWLAVRGLTTARKIKEK